MLFFQFESVADDRLLLQSFLEGKAQEACISLSPVDRRDYKIVKDATYELVPEAYSCLGDGEREEDKLMWKLRESL